MSKYKAGYGNSMMQFLHKRSATVDAAFLLPHLQSNMELLDCGCGPGSITLGLAKQLPQGHVVGVDISDEQLHIAQTNAHKTGVNNIRFAQASVLRLPFADNTFDVAFTHAVLSHIPDVDAAIHEMLRVIKPGGIIAIRDIDFGAMLVYPEIDIIQTLLQQRMALKKQAGAHPSLGRQLREKLHIAHCENIVVTGSAQTWSTAETLHSIIDTFTCEFQEGTLWKQAVANQTVTQEHIQSYQDAWEQLRHDPRTFVSFMWCEAIGYKPF